MTEMAAYIEENRQSLPIFGEGTVGEVREVPGYPELGSYIRTEKGKWEIKAEAPAPPTPPAPATEGKKMDIGVVEVYRGIEIMRWQGQHDPEGRLSTGFIPPDRGKRGVREGGPAATVESTRDEIDVYLDKGAEAYWKRFPKHRRPTEYQEETKRTEAEAWSKPEGQLWEPCEKCGAQPSFLPQHRCMRCWIGGAPTSSQTTGRIYLTVPFAEKDRVKAKGAKWDGDRKKWYWPTSAGDMPAVVKEYTK